MGMALATLDGQGTLADTICLGQPPCEISAGAKRNPMETAPPARGSKSFSESFRHIDDDIDRGVLLMDDPHDILQNRCTCSRGVWPFWRRYVAKSHMDPNLHPTALVCSRLAGANARSGVAHVSVPP